VPEGRRVVLATFALLFDDPSHRPVIRPPLLLRHPERSALRAKSRDPDPSLLVLSAAGYLLLALSDSNAREGRETEMQYKTVFDLIDARYQNWPGVGLLILANLTVLIPAIGRYRSGVGPRSIYVVSAIFTLVTIFSFGGSYILYVRLSNAVRSGQARFVEGPVTKFFPMPWWGHRPESFVVNGHEFEYEDYFIKVAFSYPAYRGGPIREGLQVRVWYVGPYIVRLEIADPPPSSEPTP